MSARHLLTISLSLVLGTCMTSAPAHDTTQKVTPFVSRINLSKTVGSVGDKFVSTRGGARSAPASCKVALQTSTSHEVEVEVRSLPPGLHFDRTKMAIVGVPKADGFFSVTIAARKERGSGIHFATPEGAWFSERHDIDIYRPIEDDVAANEFRY